MAAFTPALLEQEICRFVAEMQDCACEPQDNLKALGVDSIAFLELVIFLEKRFQVPLPLQLITTEPLSTPSRLAELLSTLALRTEVASPQ